MSDNSDNVENMTKREKLNKLDNGLESAATTFTPFIKELEEIPPTSQNYYAEYMMLINKLISDLGDPDHNDAPAEVKAHLVSVVLIKAGANKSGVLGALLALGFSPTEPSLHFALLREIAGRKAVEHLSMGMSADFE